MLRVKEEDTGIEVSLVLKQYAVFACHLADVLLKPTLTVSPPDSQAYCEDTVLLHCGLHQYRGWKYLWYQHSRSTTPLKQIWDGGGGGAVLRLWRSSLLDTGQYWCRASRGSPIFYTEYSDPVYLNITSKCGNGFHGVSWCYNSASL